MTTMVIVPVYNEVKMLPGLLEALRAQQNATFEVVFCDNASTDGTGELIRAYASAHHLNWHVVVEPQKGTGAAADTAARCAIERGATHLLRTDADCVPPANWVAAFEAAFGALDADLIAGRVVMRDDEGYSRLARWGLNTLSDLTRLGAALHYRRSPDPKAPYLGPHRMLPGGNMGITAELYERAGGFARTRIEDAHEDLQLLLTVRRLTTRYAYALHIEMPMSVRRIRAWGIVNTIRWYTDHTWRPASGEEVDIR